MKKNKAAVLINTWYQVQQPESSFFPGFPILNNAFLTSEQTLNVPGRSSKLKGPINFEFPASALRARPVSVSVGTT